MIHAEESMMREQVFILIGLTGWVLAFRLLWEDTVMRKFITAVGITVIAMVTMTTAANANHQDGTATITCSAVSGSFSDFTPADHPIVWHVKIGAGAYQTVATTDFVGASGTATASVSGLTSGLAGVPTVMSAFATWTGHTGDTTTTTVTCGEVPTTTTVAPTTTTQPPTTTTQPPAPPVAPPAPPILVPARFTG